MRKIYKIIFTVILSGAVFLSCSSKPEPVILGRAEKYYKKEGMKKTPEVWEDGIRTNPNKSEFEWWYFDAHLDDGTVVVIVFFTKSMIDINSKLNPYVSTRIAFPDGTHHNIEQGFSKDQFSASREKCDVVIGKNRVTGNLKEYHIYTNIDGRICDLKLKRSVPSWRPGVGKWYFGKEEKDYFGWFPSVPYGEISGTITYKGKIRKVKGSGYHDHNWGNIAMSKIWNNWWWSRSQIGGYTNMAIELTTTKKYGNIKLPLFMLSKGNKLLFDDESKMVLNRFDLFKHPKGEKNVENRLEFIYTDGNNHITLNLKRKKDILVYGFVDKLSLWKRVAAKILRKDPWYYRILGNVELELNIDGKKESYKNETVYELMFLGDNIR